jgi:hypothetical protein
VRWCEFGRDRARSSVDRSSAISRSFARHDLSPLLLTRMCNTQYGASDGPFWCIAAHTGQNAFLLAASAISLRSVKLCAVCIHFAVIARQETRSKVRNNDCFFCAFVLAIFSSSAQTVILPLPEIAVYRCRSTQTSTLCFFLLVLCDKGAAIKPSCCCRKTPRKKPCPLARTTAPWAC